MTQRRLFHCLFSFSAWARTLAHAAISTFSTAAVAATPVFTLSVDTRADRHAISPDIYGMSFANPELAEELSLPVNRWGGNNVERHNWRLGAVHTAQDYFFENIADCFYFGGDCSKGNTPRYRSFVRNNLAVGTAPLIQLPMVGFVARDAPTGHPLTCSFPKSQFPDQKAFDPFDLNCGNGIDGNGNALTAAPSTTGMAVQPGFSAAWIRDLKMRFGSASTGGVRLYQLGNEPALWSRTHRDVHPEPVTYDELFTRSRDLAIAVKQSDAAAKVLAFSEWGWPNYFCSAADTAQGPCSPRSPDRAAHGGISLAAWLLQQFRDYEQFTGRRLMDYFDLHYYRQGGNTADVTRSLWDPAYQDPSFIKNTIRLLPRMREWVRDHYPGTRISLSEYNLSIPKKDRLNAIIQADVLGIFARERLDLATRFDVAADSSNGSLEAIYDAFRLYRNYDGKGSKFGDIYLRSTSTDQRKLSIYSAQRSTDGRLTIAVINKTGQTLTSRMTLKGSSAAGDAKTWRWTGDGIQRTSDRNLGTTLSYPAMSMTLYVLALR